MCLYADDMKFTWKNWKMFEELMKTKAKVFNMADIIQMSYCLSLTVMKYKEGILSLKRINSIIQILGKFNKSHHKHFAPLVEVK